MNTIEVQKKIEVPTNLYVSNLKPLSDYIVAALLIVCMSPLLLLLSILIKLESKGPVIFKQDRVGKDNKVFQIYKFRSMYASVPIQGRSPTQKNDPRITRIGKFIRKTSLDELPQLFNILKGDMSFIGPRPEQTILAKEFFSDYENQRQLVKPGITGLWQVSNSRKEPIYKNISYDLYYVSNVSMGLDIRILIKTFMVLIKSNTY